MKIATLSLLTCTILVVCSSYGAQAQNSTAGQSVVPGTIENVAGSPVALSDARYIFNKSVKTSEGIEVRANGIKIQNISGHDIKHLVLGFDYHFLGSVMRLCSRVGGLATGESRDYLTDNMKLEYPFSTTDVALKVVPTGAEFKDGSHWAAPRTKSWPLESRSLRSGSCFLIRECQLSAKSYSISFEVSDPKIVAYCLGVVRDMPESYEVRLGKWVDLSEVKRDSGGRFIDSCLSLRAEQMFSKDAETKPGGDGGEISESSGVAIFVSALRFADGRVWSQDTSRHELLWDN